MTEAAARNESVVTYFGQPMKVCCDRQCQKAWGINNRPRVQLSNNEDDYAYLADDELGEAPERPATWEGGDTKPISPDDFPNKWCVRECERCEMSEPGKWRLPLPVRDFSQRRYNIPKSERLVLRAEVSRLKEENARLHEFVLQMAYRLCAASGALSAVAQRRPDSETAQAIRELVGKIEEEMRG